MTHDTDQDFRSKYTNLNPISRRLLDGFFTALTDLVRPLPVRNALEVACGEGFSTSRIREILPPSVPLHASDVEMRLAREARGKNPRVPVCQESIFRLARGDRQYDLVIALEVLEHLDDPRAALRELCRVSRRWVLVSVPREPIWRALNFARLKYVGALGNTPGHIQHWSSGAIRRLVDEQASVTRVRKPLPWTMVLAEVASPTART